MQRQRKILVCRSDKMGDVLLSLPTIAFLRRKLPNAEIAFLTQPNLSELITGYLRNLGVRNFKVTDPWDQEEWDEFIALFCDFKIAKKIFLKRIPVRVGQLSRWWSFLFFNRGLRQKRSQALKSEGLYSLELAKLVLSEKEKKDADFSDSIVLPQEAQGADQASRYLQKIGIQPDKAFIIIHPGMAGSALNLNVAQYAELIKKLAEKTQVLLSVGPLPSDLHLAESLSRLIPDIKKVEGLDLSTLKEVFRKSQCVVAPSTGPLHLAHLVGVPTIGIYSPVKSHHPRRWGPWGGKIPSITLYPEVNCPGTTGCWGASCQEFDCMNKLGWASLILRHVDGLR